MGLGALEKQVVAISSYSNESIFGPTSGSSNGLVVPGKQPYILTAYHVLAGGLAHGECSIQFQNRSVAVEYSRVRGDPASDVGIYLLADEAEGQAVELAHVSEGEKIILYTAHAGGTCPYEGVVREANTVCSQATNVFVHSVRTASGFSGAPIFTLNGKLAGIHVAANHAKKRYYAAQSEAIQAVISSTPELQF